MDAKDELLQEIEAERRSLERLVKKGVGHPEVLEQSRKVDELLRRYYLI